MKNLGWDQATWDMVEGAGDGPDSECKAFDDLTKTEKWSAFNLGWTAGDWDSFDCAVSLTCF